jgi:hypothetical protein
MPFTHKGDGWQSRVPAAIDCGRLPPRPGANRIVAVHWRSVHVTPEMFAQVHRIATARRDSAHADIAPEATARSDQPLAMVLRVCDCDFILGFKTPHDSVVPEPDRPEGQMRRYGFMPLGIAHDDQVDTDAVYVLVSAEESPMNLPPYLGHDVWIRLMAILRPHIDRPLHVILWSSGTGVFYRVLDFFFYSGQSGTS